MARFVGWSRLAALGQPILLGLLMLILLLIYWPSFMSASDFDEFTYVQAALTGERVGLFLGRAGMSWFHHGIWWIAHQGFGLAPDRLHILMRAVHAVAGVVAVTSAYGVYRAVFAPRWPLLIAVVLTSVGFVHLYGTLLTEPLSLSFVWLSMWLLVSAVQRQALWRLYLSAFLIGYAFTIRETSVLALPFHALYLLLHRREIADWQSKHLVLAGLLCTLVAAFPQVIFLHRDGADYATQASGHWAGNTAPKSLHWTHFRQTVMQSLPLLAAPLGLVFAALAWRRDKGILLLSLALMIPFAAHFIVGNGQWRFFIVGHIPLALLTAYGIDRIGNAIRPWWGKAIVLLALLVSLGIWWAPRFDQAMRAYQNRAQKDFEIGQMISRQFQDQDLLIVGSYSSMMDAYWNKVLGRRFEVQWSGWAWPGPEGLEHRIVTAVSEGRQVGIYLDGFRWPSYANEKKHIQATRNRVVYRRVEGSLWNVASLKDPGGSAQGPANQLEGAPTN